MYLYVMSRLLLTSKIAFKARKKVVSSASAEPLFSLVLNEKLIYGPAFFGARNTAGGWKASCGR
jgi:hypothetical protein